MSEFFINVLASLIGGSLIILITAFVSHKARWIIVGLLGRILDVDIDYVYGSKKDSHEAVKKEIERAKWVKIMAGRGNELQRDTFQSIYTKKQTNTTSSVKILLPQTRVPEGHYDWHRQRELELSSFDPAFGSGLNTRQIESIYSYLSNHIENDAIQLKKFNLPNIGRIIVTDRCLIYTPYSANAYASDSKVYIFRRQCEMYNNLDRFFNQAWEVADDA